MTQPKIISALLWQPEINPKWLGKMNESQVKSRMATSQRRTLGI